MAACVYHYPDVGGSFIVTGEILAFASWMSLVIPVDDLRVGSGLSGSEPCESVGIWDIINDVSVVLLFLALEVEVSSR